MRAFSITYIAIVMAIIMLLLLVILSLVINISYLTYIFQAIMILYHIALPIEVLRYYDLSPKDYHIHVHHLDTLLDRLWGYKHPIPIDKITLELINLLKTSAVILLPYTLGYMAFAYMLNPHNISYKLTMPDHLLYEVIIQIFIVALPEEIFYRGFLQSALLKSWPNKRSYFGIPLGRSIIITNIFFALGHLAPSFNPARLLTFFPGLIFSYLIYKNKSLISPVLFHALCNLWGMVLVLSLG